MAVANFRKFIGEASSKAGAFQKYRMSIPGARMAFRIMGGILVLSSVVAMQSTYGSEPSNASRAAPPAQASPAASSAMATKNASAVNSSSPASKPEDPSKIVWEPIGKYSQAEINVVSDTVGELFGHMKKMEAIESGITPLVRGTDKAADKGAKLRAAKKYSIDAEEESKKIDQFALPALENRQAAEKLVTAKAALKNASEIQKKRASKVMKMFSGSANSKALADEVQALGAQRLSIAFQFVTAYLAYESYGFTPDQIDLETGRLRKDAKPDRLGPDAQTPGKSAP